MGLSELIESHTNLCIYTPDAMTLSLEGVPINRVLAKKAERIFYGLKYD